MHTIWHMGDECEPQGEEILHGATWLRLRRLSDGKILHRRVDSERAEEDLRRVNAWRDEQASVRRLRGLP